jgi:hypothetical protein
MKREIPATMIAMVAFAVTTTFLIGASPILLAVTLTTIGVRALAKRRER